MRYTLILLLALSVAYSVWSLLRSAESPPTQPPRGEGLQPAGEARDAELARRRNEAAQVCLFIHGFADIFEAGEFAAAAISESIEATVYIAPSGDFAEVRLRRHVEGLEDIPQWPDISDRGSVLTVAENSCQAFAHVDHFH